MPRFQISLCESPFFPRLSSRLGIKPFSHSFLRLTVNGAPRQEIHAHFGPFSRTVWKSLCHYFHAIAEMAQPDSWARKKLEIYIYDDANCAPDHEISSQYTIYEGREADVLPYWLSALECAAAINENPHRYHLLYQNCNTAAAALCRAMGFHLLRMETGAIGFQRTLRSLRDEFRQHRIPPHINLDDLRERHRTLAAKIRSGAQRILSGANGIPLNNP